MATAFPPAGAPGADDGKSGRQAVTPAERGQVSALAGGPGSHAGLFWGGARAVLLRRSGARAAGGPCAPDQLAIEEIPGSRRRGPGAAG